MRFFALAVLSLVPFVQEESADPYYKFKQGTTWIFQVTENNKKKKAVICVAKEEKERVTVNLEDYNGEDDKEPSSSQSLVWYVKDGYLKFGSGDNKPNDPDIAVYKIGSKKGDTWKLSVGDGDEKKEMTGSHEGLVELKVPAGTYKDVLHTRASLSNGETVDFYIAPKVGMVKLDIAGAFVAELKEVTERKDVKVAESAAAKANERNASAHLKMIATAEADFRSNDRDNNKANDFWVGDVSGLFRHLGGGKNSIKLIEISVGEADAAPLAIDELMKHTVEKPVPQSGYYFKMMTTDENGKAYAGDGKTTGPDKYRNYSKFGVCTYPAEYGKTGTRTFIMNEAATIYWRDTGGKAVDRFPSDDDLKKDWKNME